MTDTKRPFSSIVVDGVEQAPSRAMLYPVGFKREDFAKAQVGIASTWSMVTPCNMHINDLADAAAMGADEAGAKSVVFNTVTVSDGISMGTPGMRYSLVSREVIADSIETVVGAQGFDGFVAIGGCGRLRLRRHDPDRRRAPRHHLGVRGGGCPRGPDYRRRRTARRGADRDSGAGILRGHVHGEHNGVGHRGDGPVAAELVGAGGRQREHASRRL